MWYMYLTKGMPELLKASCIYFQGYTGKGGLTACACGSVFASPTPRRIMPAVHAACGTNKSKFFLFSNLSIV